MPAPTRDRLTLLDRQFAAFRASTVYAGHRLFAAAAARLIEVRRLGFRSHARPEDLRVFQLWRDEIGPAAD